MSIKPITINIRESNKIEESRDKTSKRELINSRIFKENVKKNSSILKNNRTFLSPILEFFQEAYATTLQQRKSRCKSQLELFESSTKYFIVIGKYLGLFPILAKKKPEKSYHFLSWRYAFSFIIYLAQLVATIFCFMGILKSSKNIRNFAYITYYGTTCLSSLLVMRLATKWHVLLKHVEAANLNEYIDPYVQFKCNIATFLFLTFAFVDHVLSNIPKYLAVLDCISNDDTVYEEYILRSYSWFFEIGLPYALPFGIILPIFNIIVAVNWSYSHIFVICVSLYLRSIIKQINKKIISSEGQNVSVTFWGALRQDYNQATKLVHSFDEVINSIVLSSFASNLFFVCLQMYYVLRNDASAPHGSALCLHNTTEQQHTYLQMFLNTYFVYSSIFLIIRTFIVSIIVAEVHSASLEVAPVLYSVPSSTYCIEVQRFIEQVHGNKVALTGLNFFYVTKELVLSMIGTVITYELVLLQLD